MKKKKARNLPRIEAGGDGPSLEGKPSSKNITIEFDAGKEELS